MPSFSAKVYEQLGVGERKPRHETLLAEISRDPTVIRDLLPAGHKIGEPEPIFREIKLEEAAAWKAKFAGAGASR